MPPDCIPNGLSLSQGVPFWKWCREFLPGLTALSHAALCTAVAPAPVALQLRISDGTPATTVTNDAASYYFISACKNGAEISDSDEVSAIPTAGVASPCLTKDIGMPGYTGGASLVSGVFTILGGGDCTVIARVTAVGKTDASAKAGVMIRESLTSGSKHAFMGLSSGNGALFQTRNTTGGSSLNANKTGLAAPYWVKVTRVGNVFTGFTSPNGTTWTKVDQQSITMTTGVSIGLAVTSHNDGVLCTATFQNVTATP